MNRPSHLTAWDREYIEHLIRRGQMAQREYEAQYAQDQFMGEDRYYWDIHSWPKPAEIQAHHEVMVIRCPECHTRLELSLVPSCAPPSWDHLHRTAGCEFFRAEQAQWVDDFADLRRGETVLRGLSDTERALLLSMRLNPGLYLMSVVQDDGQLVRTPVHMPPLTLMPTN